jgi:hypothetical protein
LNQAAGFSERVKNRLLGVELCPQGFDLVGLGLSDFARADGFGAHGNNSLFP